MSLKNMRLLAVLGVLLAATALFADDDDDEDEEHEEHERHHRASFLMPKKDSASRQLDVLPGAGAKGQAAWKTECAGCHMLYHPGLLPERSWKKMMAGLSDHFGDNAELELPVQKEITEFLVALSADRGSNRRSGKILRSIKPSETPLQISQTLYFERKHDEIRPDVYKRPQIKSAANCKACHPGAESGDFSEHRVKIPR